MQSVDGRDDFISGPSSLFEVAMVVVVLCTEGEVEIGFVGGVSEVVVMTGGS